ncbi:hypothetical protein SEA_EKHEIN_66 [Gordonia phage Ekhein]|nr:hypothetical protein SEA_EKHEIN_66 [Gordonia phage Ekhein]
MDGMDMAGMFEAMDETVKDPAFQEKVFGHELDLLVDGKTTLDDGSVLEIEWKDSGEGEVIRHEADTD